MKARLFEFWRDTSGAIAVFIIVLFPLFLLIGGLATDVTLLNGQKRHVQSQADLAAQSAARYLPDRARAEQIARQVVAANPGSYAPVAGADAVVLFGDYSRETGFRSEAEGATSVSAIEVTVPSRFHPMLLSPVLSDDNLIVRRSAVGQQRGMVVFTLRNRLLSVDTSESILDAVLGPLGLGIEADVLGYQGLATARVGIDDLLGLVSTDVGLDVLSFGDVLNLPIGTLELLQGLVSLGGLPDIAINPSQVNNDTLSLGQIVGASPTLLQATVGDILPDLSVNVFDLLMVMAGLAADPDERVNVNLGVDLSPLANVSVSLGLIRAPVIAMGYVGDVPPPTARVSQVSLLVSANVLSSGTTSLLSLRLNVQIASAEAWPLSLNCGASAPADTLAVFRAETAPAELAIRLGVLSNGATVGDPMDLDTISVAGGTKDVAIPLNMFRKPVPVPNPLTLSGTVASLGNLLDDLSDSLMTETTQCSWGLLGVLLCSIVQVVNTVVATVLDVLATVLDGLAALLGELTFLDTLLQTLLDLLGIGVAQADLILDDYSCGSALVQ